jgi:hypothetical protein
MDRMDLVSRDIIESLALATTAGDCVWMRELLAAPMTK